MQCWDFIKSLKRVTFIEKEKCTLSSHAVSWTNPERISAVVMFRKLVLAKVVLLSQKDNIIRVVLILWLEVLGPVRELFICHSTSQDWIAVKHIRTSQIIFEFPPSRNTIAVSICTRILKYRVWKIKFDELEFLSSLN